MQITRQSPATGAFNAMELDVSRAAYEAWQGGMLIQDAMPNLTADEREFLITGMYADEWDEMFAEDDDLCAEWEGPQ